MPKTLGGKKTLPPASKTDIESQLSQESLPIPVSLDSAKFKPLRTNSDRKQPSGMKDNQSNFTFKADEESLVSPKITPPKPALGSIKECDLRESLAPVECESFVPKENYEELSKMYLILQKELNKAFNALLEFKHFEEAHNALEKEHNAFKASHTDCVSAAHAQSLEHEISVLKEENEQLRKKNKRAASDIQDLHKKFEKGIQELRNELSGSNQDLEAENQRLRKENAELSVKCSTQSILEVQLRKSVTELEGERRGLLDRLAERDGKGRLIRIHT